MNRKPCATPITSCTSAYSYHKRSDETSLDRGAAVYDSWINYLKQASGCEASVTLLEQCKADVNERLKATTTTQKRVFNQARLQIPSLSDQR
jgi:hypothetical protein